MNLPSFAISKPHQAESLNNPQTNCNAAPLSLGLFAPVSLSCTEKKIPKTIEILQSDLKIKNGE
jgi:hypothetical protein